MMAHEAHHANLSELENYSDSDWLDIPSSRASEDNDSVAGYDDSSDHEGIGRPSSRRSFSSLASSHEGVVEGWEGLIEDSPDEVAPHDRDTFIDPITSAEIALDDPHPAEDNTDDELVKAALDQSMMSTLSSSRSSMQTSMVRSTRDLRLSFPDPLTSSREQLSNTSYEDLAVSNTQELTVDSNAEYESSSVGDAADPGIVATPEAPTNVVQPKSPSDIPAAISPDFCIVLYGSSGLNKTALVDGVLDKWAFAAGLRRSCNLTHTVGVTTQVFITKNNADEAASSRRYVSVVDRTGHEAADKPTAPNPVACPSLAIIFLPSSSSDFKLPEHTFYLPVVVPNHLTTVDVFASVDYLLDAEQQWEAFGIPLNKLTCLSEWSMPVIDEENLEKASVECVYQVLQTLVSPPTTKRTRPALRGQTIMLAMFSLVLGYVVHGSFRSMNESIPHLYLPNRTIDAPQTVGTETQHVAALITSSVPIAAISPVMSKALDVTIYNSLSTVASTSSVAPSIAIASSSNSEHNAMELVGPTECSCGCGMVTWHGKTESTDLMVRPPTPAPALLTNNHSNGPFSIVTSSRRDVKGKGKASPAAVPGDTSIYALSVRIAGSISAYIDRFESCTISKAASKDIQELLDALDRLAAAISHHTSLLWDHSRGAASLLRDEFFYRNGHAKERAKELKGMGEQIMGTVGEQIKSKSEVAKEKAQNIKDRLAKSELAEKIKKARKEYIQSSKARRIKRKEKRVQRKERRAERKARRPLIR